MRVFTLALLISQAVLFSSFAQVRLSGTVIDSQSGSTVPYAYVTLKGVALGTVTNGAGRFELLIPEQYKNGFLVFSYVGYETQTHKISALQAQDQIRIKLKEDITILNEVVIVPQKQLTAKALLKKVMDKIPENYPDQAITIDGYYRETIRENGAYIKYADAVCSYYYEPYSNEKYKWKDYAKAYTVANGSLSVFNYYAGARLHRAHFHHETLKNDQVAIIDSRASEDQSKTNMHANIEGGPLGILGRDRVKFQQAFLGKKKFRQFDYELGEIRDENDNWLYVLSFHTSINVDKLEKLSSKKTKQWRLANQNKLLKGKLYIDQEDFAIVRYEASVPNHLKDYFCSYTDMAIKHFDYKIEASFSKKGDKYYLDKIRHEDEFIYRDSVNDITTPYAAVSELFVKDVSQENVIPFEPQTVFGNYNVNQLYDYPLEYHADFWQEYEELNPQARVSAEIRADMEVEKTMEEQFRDKHQRDESMTAPVALQVPVKSTYHGDTRTDYFAWLKDPYTARSDARIMGYIEAENKYTDNYFIPLRSQQRDLFQELTSRVEKNYTSLPQKIDGYQYYISYNADAEYPVYHRQKGKKEEVLLDVNKLAEDMDYYEAGNVKVSPDTRLMAYYENTTGSDAWVLKFKDLHTGKMLTDSIVGSANMEWIDNQTILYVQQEKKTYRTFKVLRHHLGEPQSRDETIFVEKDRRFYVAIKKSRSREFIYLRSESSTTSEVHVLRTDHPRDDFRIIAKREDGHLYAVTDYGPHFYIHTNKGAPNFKIMQSDTADMLASKWKTYIKGQQNVMINGFLMFDNYTVVREKENVQNRIRVIERQSQKEHVIKFKEDIYNVSFGFNPDTNTDSLQIRYESMLTPETIFSYHMGTKERVQLKKQEVPTMHLSTFGMKVERLWATAKDGTKIPVTLMYRKWSKKKDHPRLYLTSYGAYGSGMEIGFNHTVFSFTNREFIYAIAHVRGGDDMGRSWYEDGKMLNKMNTFTDFIDVAEFLIEEGYAEKGNIVAEGGSAGGLLMGAVANMRPDLFKMVILEKPFVDVLNTMLDDKLPGTVGEYEEWGSPKVKKYYKYIKSYSPYDNVTTQDYPHMIFLTGLNDTRVGYWEPAKMVARLRAVKTDDHLLLLKTDLTSGHGGGSGRYAYYRELAYKLALIVDVYTQDTMDALANSED